ncbi:hypothetical protein I4U23_003685 [Adineta vaga]|nr:hypothetical protein I4U23_003685 [Adineta vaga]
MNKPTGMNTGTAQHFAHVRVQLHNAIHQNNLQQLHPAFGQAHQNQPIRAVAFASRVSHYGGQQPGGYPAANPSVGEFARRFAHHLVHNK